MATIAAVRVPAADTLLGSTFEQVPTLECEMEQVIAADDFGLWMTCDESRTELEAALAADPSVDTFDRVTAESDRWLYTVECADAVTNLLSSIVEEGGTILTASGNGKDRRWMLRLRFPDRESIRRVNDRLVDRGLTVDLVRISDLSGERPSTLSLTEEQHETLVAAITHGYFDIPRQLSMEELADELGISHQATSERLRRAYRTLVTTELDVEPGGDSDSASGSGTYTDLLENE